MATSVILFMALLMSSVNYASCQSRAHILLIVVDDLRASVLPTYGGDAVAPNLEKLANQSLLFERAYAQQSLCGPSRTSFLTSRRPDSLGLYDNDHHYWRTSPLAGNFTTIPQYFKENGYYAASYGKIFHPGKISGHTDDYPYSWSRIPFHGVTEKYKNAPVCSDGHGAFKSNLVCPVNVSAQPFGTLPDIESAKEVLELLSNYSKSPCDFDHKPLFVALGFNKPHIPFKFPEEYLDFYPENVSLAKYRTFPQGAPLVAWNPWTDVRSRDDVKNLNLTFPFDYIPENFQEKIIKSYLAATTYVDTLIGTVIHQLEKLNLMNDTIVVLLSDHGWQLGEHGEWGKYSNFEAALRVPLLISTPHTRRDGGVRLAQPIELVDLFPTLVDLAGLEPIEKCSKGSKESTCTDGQSMVANSNNYGHYAGSQYPRPSITPTLTSDQPETRDINFMGYTVKDTQSGARYTEWLPFDHVRMKANWTGVLEQELYLDDLEIENEAFNELYSDLIRKMSSVLRAVNSAV